MNLLQGAVVNPHARADPGAVPFRQTLAVGNGAEGWFHQFHQSFMVDVTADGNHDVFGMVEAPEKRLDHPGIEIKDIFPGAQYGTSQGMITPEIGARQQVDIFFGGILNHADLLKYHRPFPLHLGGIESRVEKDVRQYLHHGLHMAVQDLGMVAGVLHGGEGIVVTTNGIELFSDLIGAAAGRPLKDHVFDEMTQSVLFIIFIPGAHIHPDSHGDGANVGYLLRDDFDAVLKDGFIDHRYPFLRLKPLCGSGEYGRPGIPPTP